MLLRDDEPREERERCPRQKGWLSRTHGGDRIASGNYRLENPTGHVIWETTDFMTTQGNSLQKALIAFLESIGIDVNLVPYPAHSTVEEGRSLRGDMPGTFTKNLLLKDKKGRLFLIVAEEARLIDLRTLHVKIGARGRLGFAPSDILREVLGVEPGALTPLALLHDRDHATTVVLDAKIMNDTQLNFHPLVNTESIGLSPTQLVRFITATGHQHVVAELDI